MLSILCALVGLLPSPARITSSPAHRSKVETMAANDSRHAAGTLKDGILRIRLEARVGMWYPEGEHGAGVETAGWSEVGKALENPGPAIRVVQGTIVRASIHNALPKPLTVYGFGKARGTSDSIVVAPGATRDVEFMANTVGTYWYAGHTVPGPVQARTEEDSQLNGAIVVDPPGAPLSRDRVLLISWWFTFDTASTTGLGRTTMTINGLSWPHTEKLDLVQNDSVHWRVINLSGLEHPMHLHGFYYRIEAKGDGAHDTLFTRDQRRMTVTEIVAPGQTMAMSFLPDRPGNWIFHCHFASHLSHHVAMDTHKGVASPASDAQHMANAPHQMYGLVMGLRVAPRGRVAKAPRDGRAIRLLVRQKPNVYEERPGYSFVLGGTDAERIRDSLVVPGPVLILERGKPVAITIVNQSQDRAAVHWHGIELQSYPDGVPGWSGMGKEILPSVGVGDSIVVRFTPPRAGTFMYHSHFNEFQQITSGLYGPIVVLEPGAKYDADLDRVIMVSDAGPTRNFITGPFPAQILNGSEHPAPLEFQSGKRYRLRVIGITGDLPTEVTLSDGTKPIEWRALARDGMDLPPSQAKTSPAHLRLDPGQIFDFEFSPTTPATLSLQYGIASDAALPGYKPSTVEVHVK